jgi:predicted short-subunit dehydrogenase-like oxidoreductase (DUF2520 family)
MKEIKKIAMIGAGRVASLLLPAFREKGLEISGIYARHGEDAENLARRVKSPVIKDLSKRIHADLILIAVSDDAIGEVSEQLFDKTDAIVAHTSGAVPMKEMQEKLNRAVFYPLQSFSIGKKIVWENVPFCIEAENDDHLNALGQLGERLSNKIYLLSSEQRKSLHLAAVFANNFANLMFELSEELLQKADIDRTILHPLILETANKILMQSASQSQTGPASRGDLETIHAHEKLLGEGNNYREIYDILTREIYNRNHDDKL